MTLASHTAGTPPRTGTVLVVDDEPSLLNAYARWLTSAGHDVATAPDAKSAIERIEERRFDAIVSDISMPEMDGVQLLRAVRQRDLDVPVILVTGTPTLDSSIRAIEYGALRYLVKPFEAKMLKDVVQRAIQVRRLARLERQASAVVAASREKEADLATLEAAFERARASLHVAYQPIVSWSKHLVFAYEALLRSDEPSLATPDAVLHAAERLGRLHDVGRAVRESVATDIGFAPAELVFVNLHPLDLLDETLYGDAAPLAPHATRVVLEITERAALDHVPDFPSRIERLRALGYRIAVDDLGAGYSGLASLAQLEPEVVKFDMSLVRRVHESPTKEMLIESMTSLFDDMGLYVVAEGIELAEERDTLVEAGCDLFQGFLFAKPDRCFPEVHWA